jgi:hypothetical protein
MCFYYKMKHSTITNVQWYGHLEKKNCFILLRFEIIHLQLQTCATEIPEEFKKKKNNQT